MSPDLSHANDGDPGQSHDPHNVSENSGIGQAPTLLPQPHPQPSPRSKMGSDQNKSRMNVMCRYFNTAAGCRSGDACLYRQDSTTADDSLRSHKEPGAVEVQPSVSDTVRTGGMDVSQPRAVVSRPVPAAQRADPRQFQISQIRRRFSPDVKDGEAGTLLIFKLRPTDPDFPFELDGLNCTLVVPRGYPSNGRPTLKVSNSEMERGYQINVERGFDSLVNQFPQKTLLALMSELDKNLEKFLTSQKAQTIKIVTHAGKKVGPKMSEDFQDMVSIPTEISFPPTFTEQQKLDALQKRESDVRQLEARLSRQPLFSRNSDGTSFSLPLQVPKSSRLPLSLQSVKETALFVPLLYNLEPCTVILKDVDGPEARAVEFAFEKRARDQPEMTLMAHINYLAQNMHLMVKETSPENQSSELLPTTAKSVSTSQDTPRESTIEVPEESKSRIQIIPRPPEWMFPDTHSGEEDSSDASDSEEEYTDEEDGGAAISQEINTNAAERGVAISFPSLELYGIELLQLVSMSLIVKCDRCRTPTDVTGITPQAGANKAIAKQSSCLKCASPLSVNFRSDLMHPNSVRAGYLDLDGCTVSDLLPSSFVPTCSECSTSYPAPGVVSVRGETTLAICRECHHKMSFKIPEVKFLRISTATRSNLPLPPKRKPKENLGIVAGQELPRRGRCDHYSKSHRWFRFGCCSKVYPCDRCHDAAEEHPNEHANRMICGFCSREQAYRPEDCIHCHNGLTGRKGGGFWEGGKGTRDKVRMSRKDPRKYKRRGGGRYCRWIFKIAEEYCVTPKLLLS